MVNWTNISNAMTKLGAGLTQTALTSMTLRASRHCGSSIFGFGCGYGFTGGMMNLMYNPMYNPMSNPMGIGVFSPYNSYNTMNTQYGNALAYQWGLSLGQQSKMNSLQEMPQLQNLQKTTNKYAGDIDKNQDTTKGAEFNKATNELVNEDGEAVKDKSVTISNPKNGEEYTNNLSDLSKSFLANIDKSVGNGDGEITADEYVNYEMKSPRLTNADAKEKLQAMQSSQIAFSKLDQNGDNKLDWKEMAAGLATFDSDSSVKTKNDLDGVITSKDYEIWSTRLVDQTSNIFDNAVRRNYQTLFGEKDKTEES